MTPRPDPYEMCLAALAQSHCDQCHRQRAARRRLAWQRGRPLDNYRDGPDGWRGVPWQIRRDEAAIAHRSRRGRALTLAAAFLRGTPFERCEAEPASRKGLGRLVKDVYMELVTHWPGEYPTPFLSVGVAMWIRGWRRWGVPDQRSRT